MGFENTPIELKMISPSVRGYGMDYIHIAFSLLLHHNFYQLGGFL